MGWSRFSQGFVVASMGLMVASGCTNGPVKTDVGVNEASSRCKQQPEQTVKLQSGIEAGFQQGLLKFEGQAAYEQLVEVKNKFDTLQADYAQMSYQLCEDSATESVSRDYYERRRECLDQALLAMRAMDLVLSEKISSGPEDELSSVKEATWELDAKMAWLQEILACPKEGQSVLAAPKDATPAQDITLTAYLICQKKVGSKFVDVPECTESSLRENDRIKIGFRVDKPARLYVLNYNDTGLFQTIFPDRGIANEIEPGRDYILPPDDWLELDDQSDVVEHLQVVASLEKIQQLEDLRGAYFEPKPGDKAALATAKKASVKTRGLLEPVLSRGFKQKGKPPVMLEAGGATVQTVPIVASKPGVNVIEFKLTHQ